MIKKRAILSVFSALLLIGVGITSLGLLNSPSVAAQSADPDSSLPWAIRGGVAEDAIGNDEPSTMVAGDPANADSGPLDSVSPSTPAQITGIASLAELTPVADTWVDHDHPSSNYGGANALHADNGDEQWSLLGFDLSSLPDHFDVYSATLSMYTRINLAAHPTDLTLVSDLKADVVADNWVEMSVTWDDRPASAHLLDPPTTYNVDGWTVWDVTNIVQNWGDGSLPNYGLRIWSDPAGTGGSWWTRETAEPPKLTISYVEAPPPCNPITAVDVNGATSGVTGTNYSFSTSISPAGADPPDNISWQVTDYAERLYGESVSLSWDTPGQKTLTVVVTHCGGSTSTVHTVDISDPPPDCAYPVTGVRISGPVVVDTEAVHAFESTSVPFDATDPSPSPGK